MAKDIANHSGTVHIGRYARVCKGAVNHRPKVVRRDRGSTQIPKRREKMFLLH